MNAHRVDFSVARGTAVYERGYAMGIASGAQEGLLKLRYHGLRMVVLTKTEIHNETRSERCYLMNSS